MGLLVGPESQAVFPTMFNGCDKILLLLFSFLLFFSSFLLGFFGLFGSKLDSPEV